MRKIVSPLPMVSNWRRWRRVNGSRPWSLPWQRFSKMAKKKTVSDSIVQALLRSRFSGATWMPSVRSSKRQMISSRSAAGPMLGGMMKRTSMGVPRLAESVSDFSFGPGAASASDLALVLTDVLFSTTGSGAGLVAVLVSDLRYPSL